MEITNIFDRKRSYKRWFREWGFIKPQIRLHEDSSLVMRVRELWEQNYSTNDMLWALSSEGYANLTAIQLRDLRLHPSVRLLMSRSNNDNPRSNIDAALPILQDAIANQGRRYGFGYMATYIRSQGVFISEYVYLLINFSYTLSHDTFSSINSN